MHPVRFLCTDCEHEVVAGVFRELVNLVIHTHFKGSDEITGISKEEIIDGVEIFGFAWSLLRLKSDPPDANTYTRVTERICQY